MCIWVCFCVCFLEGVINPTVVYFILATVVFLFSFHCLPFYHHLYHLNSSDPRDSSCVNRRSIIRRRRSQPPNHLLLPRNRLAARSSQEHSEFIVTSCWCVLPNVSVLLVQNCHFTSTQHTDLHPQIPSVYSQRSFKGPVPPTPRF